MLTKATHVKIQASRGELAVLEVLLGDPENQHASKRGWCRHPCVACYQRIRCSNYDLGELGDLVPEGFPKGMVFYLNLAR